MQRALPIVAVLLVVLGILSAAHYYIWARLVRDVGWSESTRRWLTVAVFGLGLSVPASFILSRQLPPKHGLFVLYVTYTWMGSVLTLLLTLGIGDLCRFIIEHLPKGAIADFTQPQRRQFLQRALAAAATLVTGSSTALAVREALAEVEVKNVRVRLGRLPASMHGFTIAQISDLHLGPTLREDFVRHIVSRVNGLDADLIAITGDLVDGTVEHLGEMVAPLGRLRAQARRVFRDGQS